MNKSYFQSQDITKVRLKITFLVVPFLILIILGRLFYWQIIRGPKLAAQATRQHQETALLNSKRGDILASDGSLLSGTENLYHLFVYKPQLNKSALEVADLLSPILTADPPPASPGAAIVSKNDLIKETKDNLLNRLNLNSNWISLKHYLNHLQKEKIESLNIAGLGFEDDYVRYYPEASSAAQVLGFVGSDLAGLPQGYFGLEGFYDRQLRGREGKITTEKDARGNPILIGKYNILKNIAGRSIVTTIDKNLQYIVESLLKNGLHKYQAKAGNVILLETKTGKVRAMASYPNYDPSHFSDFDQTTYKNPNVANLFEPGSIFKVLVMAAALNEQVVQPETECQICGGPLTIGQYTIKTWNETYRPNSTMTEVIVNSDNVGMVFIAQLLGKEKFLKYLDRFGLGKKTGIQLQEEVASEFKDLKDFKDIDLATNSFGQGIALTPIQIVTAVNSLANGGELIAPTIVEKIIGSDKETTLDQISPVRVISEKAAEQIRDMMIAAVDRGEAKWAKPKGIEIAGKTGTAQIPIQGHYDPEKTIASFVGFFPARNPRYTMLVSLNEPQTSQWGSETAAPLWFTIANELLLQN